MSRRKGRGRRRKPVRSTAPVVLRVPGEGIELVVQGVTAEQYEKVKRLARAGRINDPLIARFIQAFGVAIGHDVRAACEWTDADTVAFLRWLNLLPEAGWTALEEAELELLLTDDDHQEQTAEQSVTIPVVAGEAAGLTLTITGLSDGDLAEARRQAAAGHVDHVLVVRIVATFIEAVGVDVTAYTWTSSEYMALLDMLGFLPPMWTTAEDGELNRLLIGAAGE